MNSVFNPEDFKQHWIQRTDNNPASRGVYSNIMSTLPDTKPSPEVKEILRKLGRKERASKEEVYRAQQLKNLLDYYKTIMTENSLFLYTTRIIEIRSHLILDCRYTNAEFDTLLKLCLEVR